MEYTRLLEGKTAIISGGSVGMGLSIAKLFARHGARVAVCSRSDSAAVSGDVLNAISPGSFFKKCDMGVKEQVEAFCDEALKRFGIVDIIVNNVGVNDREPTHLITDEKFEKIQRINIQAVLTMIQKLVPTMIQNDVKGSIVNISTIHSVATMYGMGSYATSKGGMNAFSRVVAIDLGGYGIRSNTVCPGAIFTTIGQKYLKKHLDDGGSLKDVGLRSQNGSPCYGSGNSMDIANTCLFLASDMGSYITGATMMVDGGASYQAHNTEFDIPKNYEDVLEQYVSQFEF